MPFQSDELARLLLQLSAVIGEARILSAHIKEQMAARARESFLNRQ
jgi:hypothetical protein